MKETKSYPPDPVVQVAVNQHKLILKELEKAILCEIPAEIELSSMGMRLRPTTMGTFICSTVRQALGTECTLMGAGSIRANRMYKGESKFTYAHLKAEIPFPTEIVSVFLPGKVISDAIAHTRAFALSTPPVEKGSYLQTDDQIKVRLNPHMSDLYLDVYVMRPHLSYYYILSFSLSLSL